MAFIVSFASRPVRERLYGYFRMDLAAKTCQSLGIFWSTELFVSGELRKSSFSSRAWQLA